MEFYENLAALRKAKGLSQEEVAERLGVSRQAISKWENGLTSPEMANIAKLCEILEVSPNRLLGFDEPENETPVQNQPTKRQRPWWQYMLIVAGGILLAHIAAVVVGIAVFGTTAFIRTSQSTAENHSEIIEFEQPVISSVDFIGKQIKGDSRIIQVDFVSVISNDDYDYSLSVIDTDGIEKEYKPQKVGGIYRTDIELDLSLIHHTKIVAMITINGQTYSQHLATIREVTEDSVAWE